MKRIIAIIILWFTNYSFSFSQDVIILGSMDYPYSTYTNGKMTYFLKDSLILDSYSRRLKLLTRSDTSKYKINAVIMSDVSFKELKNYLTLFEMKNQYYRNSDFHPVPPIFEVEFISRNKTRIQYETLYYTDEKGEALKFIEDILADLRKKLCCYELVDILNDERNRIMRDIK